MPNKRKGRHPHKALSDRFIRGNLKPGKYADGNGLYLIVDKTSNRRWMLRTWNTAKGRRLSGHAQMPNLMRINVKVGRRTSFLLHLVDNNNKTKTAKRLAHRIQL